MQLYLDSCVLIYALEGYGSLRQQTLSQLERYAGDDWMISDLARMECLVGPLRSADQMSLQAFRSSHDPQGPDPQGPDPGGQHSGQPLN
jgi:hypothetical protein